MGYWVENTEIMRVKKIDTSMTRKEDTGLPSHFSVDHAKYMVEIRVGFSSAYMVHGQKPIDNLERFESTLSRCVCHIGFRTIRPWLRVYWGRF